MQKSNAIIEIFEKKGLISVKSQCEIKDKIGLSMVYTPGVGECCMQIKANENRLWDLTAAESLMYVISNGSNFAPDFKSHSPEFMLPELELQSFVHKSLVNINAFPMVFNSNIISSAQDLAWLVRHLSPCVGAIEIYDVADEFWSGAQGDMDSINCVVILPNIRKSILNFFSDCVHRTFIASLIVGLVAKVNSKLKIFGVVKEDFIVKLLEQTQEVIRDSNLDEFNLKEVLIDKIFEIHDICEPNTSVKILHETIIDFISHDTTQELFYRNYKEGSSRDNSVFIHEHYKGMIRTALNIQINDLKTFLAPKNLEIVRSICKKIYDDPAQALTLSIKKNYCAIVTDGTAILGFGHIGPKAGMPVMEGKICLFQQLGSINVIPICIDTQTVEDTVRLVKSIGESFNAINLEDISAPNCFVIEEQLNKELPIPIFHDDQHGTAVVVLAGLINSLKVVKKEKEKVLIVVNGAGAAGKAIVDLLLHYGFGNIIVADTRGAIFEGRSDLGSNEFKKDLASRTNRNKIQGTLAEVIKGADIFIGVSVGKVLTTEMVSTMNVDSIVFALANPEPEIMPWDAQAGGAALIATGRSDFPNQINNSLVFPGIFKGLIDSKIKNITLDIKATAAIALANCVEEHALSKSRILPYTLDMDVAHIIAESILKNLDK